MPARKSYPILGNFGGDDMWALTHLRGRLSDRPSPAVARGRGPGPRGARGRRQISPLFQFAIRHSQFEIVSLNYLIRSVDEGLGDGQPKGLGGLQVDNLLDT